MEKLAINGGRKAVPDGTVKNWPPIDNVDRKRVLASLEGSNHAFGENCAAFQTEFAAWNGNKFAVATNSGTAALHMALVACDVGCGDEVIVTAYSWSSSATCILHHNAIPVFVDINFDTINMDESLIERAITKKTKAIIAVHLHGLPMNMEKVMAIARRHKLKVVEDACQAHGATFKGRKVGTLGTLRRLQFQPEQMPLRGRGRDVRHRQ